MWSQMNRSQMNMVSNEVVANEWSQMNWSQLSAHRSFSRPINRGVEGGEGSPRKFLSPWKNLLNKVKDYWT